MERFLKAIWKSDIEHINDHLPARLHSLSELLESDTNILETRDGGKMKLRNEDLEQLKLLVPREYHNQLRLPFLLIRRVDLGKGIFTVGGGKLELFTLQKLLDLTQTPFSDHRKIEANSYLNWPHVRSLKNKIRSLVVIGFGGKSLSETPKTPP